MRKIDIAKHKLKFGQRVKSLRESKGWSQLDLASAMDVDKTSISRIENGRTNVTLISMIKLAKALEVELFEMLRSNKA